MNPRTSLLIGSVVALCATALALSPSSATPNPKGQPSGLGSPKSPLIVATGDRCTDNALPSSLNANFSGGEMRVRLSAAKLWTGATGQDVFASIELTAAPLVGVARPPLDVALVLDRSGSMAGDKITQARKSAAGIIERLNAGDRVAVIQYDDQAQVLVPLTAVDGEGKKKLLASVSRIQDAGGTNLGAGLELGRDQLLGAGKGRLSRVILLSDGIANVGVTEPTQLAAVASHAASRGVRVSTIGLGVDYNEDLMEALAENGRGQYHFVKDAGSLEAVFAKEVANAQATVATAAEVRLQTPCSGVEIADVLGYTFRREGNAVVIPLADLFGGDERRIIVRLKVTSRALSQTALLTGTFHHASPAGVSAPPTPLAISASFTTDEAVATATFDKELLAEVARVEQSTTMRVAADAYREGRLEEARNVIQQGRAKTTAQAATYGFDQGATADMIGEYESLGAAMDEADPGSESGKALVKGTKMKSVIVAKTSRKP